MADIEYMGGALIIHVKGWDKVWALKSELSIPIHHVVRAEYGGPLCQDTGEGHFKVETSPFSRRLAGLSGSSLVCGVVTGAT